MMFDPNQQMRQQAGYFGQNMNFPQAGLSASLGMGNMMGNMPQQAMPDPFGQYQTGLRGLLQYNQGRMF